MGLRVPHPPSIFVFLFSFERPKSRDLRNIATTPLNGVAVAGCSSSFIAVASSFIAGWRASRGGEQLVQNHRVVLGAAGVRVLRRCEPNTSGLGRDRKVPSYYLKKRSGMALLFDTKFHPRKV